MRTLAIAFALVLSAVSASAQSTGDSRWTPWLGCWDLVLENARDGSVSADLPRDATSTRPRDTTRPRVCVEAADGGATFRTTIGNETPIVQTIVADGTEHTITDGECRGTQRAEWSKNGSRLYLRAELTCKGDPAPRRVSGFAMLGPNYTWTDVQSIEIGGRDSYRVRRYRRSDAAAATAARSTGSALTIDDVKEASGKVSSQALEAAIVETNASFPLSSQRLIELDDAKVSPNVIDLMVAVSYPKRFVVERSARVDRGPIPIIDDPFGLGWAFGPIWSNAYGLYSPYYGYYSPYYYSPFSYGLGGFNTYYGGSFIEIGDAGGGGVPNRPSGAGRVVDGLGYTRVRAREPEPTAGSRPGDSTAVTGRSGSGRVTSQGFTASSGDSGGGGSSSAGASSAGSSGGASSGDGGGRTAQPR